MGGNAVGPIIGGLLLAGSWRGSVFLLAVPVMVILLAAGPPLLPEYRHPENTRLDVGSVVLSLLAILPFVYGLKELARTGAAPLPFATMALGIVVAVVFVRRQQTTAGALIDLQLFRSPPFRVTLIGERLLAAAGEAFTTSLATVATVGAVLVLAVTALCGATIARSPYAPDPASEPTVDPA